MLEGFDILAYTYADWRATWSTPQQLATRLAPRNRVLYVDVPRSFLYRFRPKDPQGAGQWDGPRVQEVRENLFVFHPPHVFLPVGRLPFPVARATLTLNGRVLGALVRRQMARLGMRRPILWNFSPLHGKAIRAIPRRVTIYDVCDEWANYVPYPSGKRVILWTDRELCAEADLVFVGTENGKALREGINPELHVVHHGADYEHFARATDPRTVVPADIAGLPRPVIGAVGVIDPERFDAGLLLYLAEQRPSWSFVIVGPARAGMDLRPLRTRANIHLLGNRAIEALPACLKGMDVTLIPYKVNEATRNIYPLKLQEYLAAGKPVVSAALPSVCAYDHVVQTATSHHDFLRKIEECLVDPHGPARVQARQAVARANSWDQRLTEKSAHILRLLETPRKAAVFTG